MLVSKALWISFCCLDVLQAVNKVDTKRFIKKIINLTQFSELCMNLKDKNQRWYRYYRYLD